MILLWIFEEEPQKRIGKSGLWGLLFAVNIVAAMMSTASVFLNTFLIAVMALVLYLQEKNWKILLMMASTCIPCGVYGLLYVLL